ncbi:MAG: hypothetical protein LBT59_24055, partial [Clostridiales bacterium]|nr:hypothetical protein [Clostridiales bacterium]
MAKSGTGKHTLESESPPHPQEEVTAEMAVKITELCFHCYDVDFEPMDIIMRIELAKCILNQNASFDVYGGLPFERGDATDNIVCKTVIPKREAEDSNDGSLAAPPAEAAAVSLNRGSFKV